MKLHFSQRPGCWERHLQRRHRNLLFPESVRCVTQEQVNEARRRDDAELQHHSDAFLALLNEVAEFPGQADSEVVLGLKERVDRLYEEASGLAGDMSTEKHSLKRLSAAIMKAVRAGAGADPQAQQELEQEEAARATHFQLLEHALVAHLLRPDGPIPPEELVPTLLTEPVEALRAALLLFDATQWHALYGDATALLTRLREQGHALPEAWSRLAVIEEALRGGLTH